MNRLLFQTAALVLALTGIPQLATAQTTTFDQMNSNVGSQKVITWNTSPHSSGFGHRLISTDPGGKTTLNFQARHNTATWSDLLVFTSDARVGIGTNSPAYQFHLKSVVGGRSRFEYGTTSIDVVDYGAGTFEYSESAGMFVTGKDALVMSGSGKGIRLITHDGSNYRERIRILANGRVGINTKNPSHQLSVNGTIGAMEVNVTATGWADYVFKPGYELMPLNEVEQFIREKGHLPNVPTEAEVMENGVNLAEMNIKLLEKVEELTLYMIELRKELDGLKKQGQTSK